MKFRFPTIEHIDQILPHIEGREDFIVGERDGFDFLDYVVALPNTFLDPMDPDITMAEHVARCMRRECRGIKFHKDGRIAARPYHKFFNIGEKDETQPNVIPWSDSFQILDKLDGSMVHPLWIDGELYFCTRMGITDVAIPALIFAKVSDSEWGTEYVQMCADAESRGYTPIFEWCTRKQRIVIDHPEDRLVVTAFRHKVSGYYLETFDAVALAYNVPSVGTWEGSWEGFDSFRDHVKGLVGAEGYVLRWRNGHMGKTKGDWYCAIHRAMDAVHWEKDVVTLILEDGLDDVLPNLLEADRDRLERFQEAFWNGVLQTIAEVGDEVNELLDDWENHSDEPHNIRARDQWFAGQAKKVWSGPERGALRSLAFKIYHGLPAVDHVKHTLSLHVGSGPRLAKQRALFGGICWEDY